MKTNQKGFKKVK